MPEFVNAVFLIALTGIFMLVTVVVLMTQREWVNGWNGAASQLGLARNQNTLGGTYRKRRIVVNVDPDTGVFGSTIIQIRLKAPPEWAFELRPKGLYIWGRSTPNILNSTVRVNQSSPPHLIEQIFMDSDLNQRLISQSASLHHLKLNNALLEYSYQRIDPKQVSDACELLNDIADALEYRLLEEEPHDSL